MTNSDTRSVNHVMVKYDPLDVLNIEGPWMEMNRNDKKGGKGER